jgi:hypothetical protein
MGHGAWSHQSDRIQREHRCMGDLAAVLFRVGLHHRRVSNCGCLERGFFRSQRSIRLPASTQLLWTPSSSMHNLNGMPSFQASTRMSRSARACTSSESCSMTQSAGTFQRGFRCVLLYLCRLKKMPSFIYRTPTVYLENDGGAYDKRCRRSHSAENSIYRQPCNSRHYPEDPYAQRGGTAGAAFLQSGSRC